MYSTSAPGRRRSTDVASSAATSEPDSGRALSSTKKTRSASPSNASPTSAPTSRTRRHRSARLASCSGSGGWFGKLPSKLAVQHDPVSAATPRRRPARRGPPCRWPRRPPRAAAARSRGPRTTGCDWAKVSSRSTRRRPPSLGDRLRRLRQRQFTNPGQPPFAAERPGARPAGLDAVVVGGVVRGGEHEAGGAEVTRGEVEHVGGDQAQVHHVEARSLEAAAERIEEGRPRESHVAPDDHLGGAGIVLAEERGEGRSEAAGQRLVEFGRDPAADVVGADDRVEAGLRVRHRAGRRVRLLGHRTRSPTMDSGLRRNDEGRRRNDEERRRNDRAVAPDRSVI